MTSCWAQTLNPDEYAISFCRVTSQKSWDANKDFLLNNASDELKPVIENFFTNVNTVDSITASIQSSNSNIRNCTGEALYLIRCYSDTVNYHVVLTLSIQNNRVTDFSFESIDEMSGFSS